jgi:hypothetical protein
MKKRLPDNKTNDMFTVPRIEYILVPRVHTDIMYKYLFYIYRLALHPYIYIICQVRYNANCPHNMRSHTVCIIILC